MSSMFSVLLIGCIGCAAKSGNTAAVQDDKDRVEVLYLHGRQRCATCRAIEEHAAETVKTLFADEQEKGTVVFRSVDISDPQNEYIAEEYQAAWSSLFVNRWRNGNQTSENLTGFAFANALTAPDRFRSTLAEKIANALKE